MNENFFLKKIVDKSFLEKGFAIPVDKQAAFACHLSGGSLAHGEKRTIKIFLAGQVFDVALRSVNFNREEHPNHKDIWQINYPAAVAKKIRENFSATREIFFCTADVKDAFYLEPPFDVDELTLENILDLSTLTDPQAAIVERYHLERVRKLNRQIGEELKGNYNFRCQICGRNVGEHYGVNLVDCHHIAPFSLSRNNDEDNLLIVCPNHHRIIHAAEPVFDRDRKFYRYPNGREEGLLLNDHL